MVPSWIDDRTICSVNTRNRLGKTDGPPAFPGVCGRSSDHGRIEPRVQGLGRWGALLLGAASIGCGADFGLAPDFPQDVPPPAAQRLVRIREDFNTRELIAMESGSILVDINRGIATLDAQIFPEFAGYGAVSAYDQTTYQNGLVEAEAIIIHEGGTLEASDSVELRAEDRIIVAGSITAGRGGVTIVARQRIQIDGTINSDGPVRLLLGDDTGTVEVGGTIDARSRVEIYGRGSVLIGGTISTFGVSGDLPANIDVYAYGDVTVTGYGARLYGTGDLDAAGSISLVSEANVTVDAGAWLGGMAPDPIMPDELMPSGDIDVRASNVFLGDDTVVAASGANAREGGRVLVTATGRLVTGHRMQLAAGVGPDGGSVSLFADAIELGEGTNVVGGGGRAQPGDVKLSAVSSISMQPFSYVQGGFGECTHGGNVVIEVGGLLSAGQGAAIIGGSTDTSATCGRGYAGGAVTIYAKDAVGLELAVMAGEGATRGEVNINLIENYTVASPNLSVGPSGDIESRTIDRGVEAIDTVPRLVELVTETPADTTVTILLSAASEPEGPFEEWLPVTSDPNDQKLSLFTGQRYVRYRVVLEGRKFDVPLVDYFEIDLAPIGY
jgi:hypothetical protein